MNIDLNKLKQVLKPLVKSLLKECLFEDGILSTIISETIIGARKSEIIVENKEKIIPQRKIPHKRGIDEDFKSYMSESREKTTQEILNKTGIGKVFENLQPTVGENKVAMTSENAQKSPTSFQAAANKSGTALRNVDPNDPGININGILNLVGGKNTWKKH